MEDRQIVELYLKRSEQAIQESKLKYGTLCNRIAFNILRCKEDAEECENDTYLKAWNSIPPKEPQPLSPYLCKIVRNLALHKYEYYNAGKRNKNLELAFSELEECLPGTNGIDSHYHEGVIVQAIDRFLRGIDGDSRKIFILRYWSAASVKEIASRFAVSESKVKSSLFRTRNKLKTYLKEEGYDL
jgi:RNA polymerase sigma-70 factor (ECF subfamily)